MTSLSYEDLMAEAADEAKDKGLEFTCKDGKVALLRPFLFLSDTEIKNALLLVEKIQDDDVSLVERMSYADKILISAADKKDSLKKSLVDLPLAMKIKVVQLWMQSAGRDLPES